MIYLQMGKTYTAKTPLGDFKVTTLEVDLSLQNILTHENTMHAEFLS